MNNSTSLNSTNLTNSSDFGIFFQASGVVHIVLVVIPVLVIGPVVLGIFVSSKKLRDPVSVVYICTSTICIVGPLTYGLLMDLSLITNLDFWGSCDSRIPRAFWITFVAFQFQLVASNALLSCVQYVTIRWGTRKLSNCAALLVFFILFVIAFLGSMIHLIGPIEERIWGSLCRHPDGDSIPVLLVAIGIITFGLFTAPPVILVVLFSVLTALHIRKKVTMNNKPVKAVDKVVLIWTFAVIILRILPNCVIFASIGTETEPVNSVVFVWAWCGVYSVELSNPLFLFLALLLHKKARTTCLSKVKNICQKLHFKRFTSKVVPSGGPTLKSRQHYASVRVTVHCSK